MSSIIDSRIEIIQGNIVDQQVDSIVNAANKTLLGGGGVDGAIHRAAGPALLEECRSLRGCPTGSAKITRGYRLPARHVIHAVGPVYRGGRHGEEELLISAYRSSLELAARNQCRTIAFPAISTGAYGYPKPAAARIALGTAIEWLENQPLPEKVIFVLFSPEDLEIYQRELDQRKPGGR